MTIWSSTDTARPLDRDGPVDVPFTRFEEDWSELPLIVHFQRVAALHRERLAVADGRCSLSYRELQHRAMRLAAAIEAAVPHGSAVGLLVPQDALMPVAVLACLAAARPYVPLDLKYPAARIAAIIDEAGLEHVVAANADDAARLLPPATAILLRDAAFAAAPSSAAASAVDDPAVILYTSGSTGAPKGICNSQRAILQRVAEATNSCHLHAGDRCVLLSSPGTIAGQREMFAALLNGASLHVTDPQRDGVLEVLNTLRTQRITVGYMVPSLLRMLLRLPGAAQAFAHLRVLRVGGDITLDSDLALFRTVAPAACAFFASFSSTETPAVFQWFVPPAWQTDGPRVPVGRARPGVDFTLAAEAGDPPGCGELVVRSRCLALGLWRHGAIMPGPFLSDPEDPARRILHTGDVVRQRADGLWELVGRKDRQVKIRGQRVDAAEVEAALRSCPSVVDAAVIARRRGEEVCALCAFVVPEVAGDRQVLMEARHALAVRVPTYMHPAAIHLVAAIPQLPGFKPDLAALAELDQQLDTAPAPTAAIPRGPADALPVELDKRIRAVVRYAWSAVLGSHSYSEAWSWAKSDGDSLKAMELWFYIEDKLGFKLPLDTLNDTATPDTLVDTIRRHALREPSVVNPSTPLIHLLPGILSDDPALARFRAGFAGSVRFRVLDYPVWQQMAAAGANFDAIADAVVREIAAGGGEQPVRLAGYSYGGLVAYEAASRLVRSGRQVAFLGLLDTRRWDITDSGLDGGFEQPTSSRLPVKLLKQSICTLVRQRRFGTLHAAERMLMLRPSKLAFWFRRQITKEMRFQAMRRWRPEPLDVPTFLYLSDDRWPGEPPDHGWDTLCPTLTKVRVGGDHGSVIQPPQRDAIRASWLRALAGSGPAISASEPLRVS